MYDGCNNDDTLTVWYLGRIVLESKIWASGPMAHHISYLSISKILVQGLIGFSEFDPSKTNVISHSLGLSIKTISMNMLALN